MAGNGTIKILFKCYVYRSFVTTNGHTFSFQKHSFVSNQRKSIANNNSQEPDISGPRGLALDGRVLNFLNFLTVRKRTLRIGMTSKLSKYYYLGDEISSLIKG
jgi:hypothetical protein